MKTIAMCDGGDEYGLQLSRELELLSVEITNFAGSDELESIIDDRLSAVVLVYPHIHLVKAVRAVIDDAGGMVSKIPVFVVTDAQGLVTEIGLLKYADDFVVAPGCSRELLTRIEVHAQKKVVGSNVISAGGLLIALDAHQVFVEGKLIDLTYKEFELLKMIAATPGRAYSREELLKNIWGYDYFGGTRTVDVHIRRLRSKIESTQRYIDTVHGVGYRFIV